MNAKKKGTRFEYRVRDYFLKKGYFVARSAGSHGIFDLIAIPPGGGSVYGIQCKTGGRLTGSQKEEMKKVARKYGIIPLFATRDGRKLKVEEVNGNDGI